MPCYHPLTAFQNTKEKQRLKFCKIPGFVPPKQLKQVVDDFQKKSGLSEWKKLSIPCGQCLGCRINHAKQWAIRCHHEASLYEKNCFVTLTYSDENLPENGSIRPNDVVLFMKRLRKAFGSGIRSFGCAEYGDKFKRPHYHLLIFNFDFPDKKLYKNQRGTKLYNAQSLSNLWPYGHAVTADLTFNSANYVAGYVSKKFRGKSSANHYGNRLPERSVSVSRRPGIGQPWLQKYMTDVYPNDLIVINGKEMKPPKSYDRSYEQIHPENFEKLKFDRAEKIQDNYEYTKDRLLIKKEIAIKNYHERKKRRSYENEN